MRQFWVLLRAQLWQRFSVGAAIREIRERKWKGIRNLALGIIVVASIGFCLGFWGWIFYSFLPAFQMLGMEETALIVVTGVSMLLTFVLGLFYVVSTLFMAKDAAFLSALPIPGRTVLACRIFQVFLDEILTGAMLMLPVFIAYALRFSVGVFYWPMVLIVLVLSPCLPLALSALLATIVVRFSILWQKRETLTTIASILFVVLFFGMEMMLTSKLPEELTAGTLLMLAMDLKPLLEKISRVFLPASLAVGALQGDFLPGVLFAAVSVCSAALAIGVGGGLYQKGASAMMETGVSGKKRRSEKRIQKHGVRSALLIKEWRLTLRSPSYMLNGLLMILMGPLMLLVLSVQSEIPGGELRNLWGMLSEKGIPVLLLVSAFLMFFGSINTAGHTVVSREGKGFSVLKMLPVSFAVQAQAKILYAFSISALCCLVTGVSIALLVGFPIGWTAFSIAFSLLASFGQQCAAMFPDFLHPKMGWSSETEAIKQNFNGFLGMLIGVIYIALLAAMGYGLFSLGIHINMLYVLMALVCLGLDIGFYKVLMTSAQKTWMRLEI